VAAQGIFIRKLQPEGSGGLSSEAETVCRHCLQILTAGTITIWKFPHSWRPDYCPCSLFHSGWGWATFWGLSPCLAQPSKSLYDQYWVPAINRSRIQNRIEQK